MKLAIIGSRGIVIENLGDHLPSDVTELVTAGTTGFDALTVTYAREHGIPLTVYSPDRTGDMAGHPLAPLIFMADYAHAVLAFWDGRSLGAAHAVKLFRKRRKSITVYRVTAPTPDAPAAMYAMSPEEIRYIGRAGRRG